MARALMISGAMAATLLAASAGAKPMAVPVAPPPGKPMVVPVVPPPGKPVVADDPVAAGVSGGKGGATTVYNAPVIAAGPATSDPAIAEALRQVTGDGDIQTAWPPPEPPPAVEPPRSPNWFDDFLRWLAGNGQWLTRTLAAILIGGVILVILYLTVPVVREWVDGFLRRKRTANTDDADQQPDWQPDATGARNLLAEADALAAAGRFAEAVHLLLGRSLEDIATRRPGLLKPALTARAIAMINDLPAQARAAFARIADAVERSLWARRAIDAGDWQTARAAYEDFAFGQHWRGGQAAAPAFMVAKAAPA